LPQAQLELVFVVVGGNDSVPAIVRHARDNGLLNSFPVWMIATTRKTAFPVWMIATPRITNHVTLRQEPDACRLGQFVNIYDRGFIPELYCRFVLSQTNCHPCSGLLKNWNRI